MSGYDFNRPYVSHDSLTVFRCTDDEESRRYGSQVKAVELSNVEYKIRFARFGESNNMKEPPSCGRIFMGYLVVRKLGTPNQYETWMPDHVFEDLYVPASRS